MTRPDDGPARPGVAVALAAGAVAAGLAGVATPLSLVLGVTGWLLLGVALGSGSRAVATGGLGALWLATVVAALAGLAVEVVGVALVASVVAWDAAGRAITLGRQLTTSAATRRIEAVHATATLAVGLGAFGLVYALGAVAAGVDTPIAVIALGLGVGLLVAAIGSG